jgi:excisionase family DNA binding protein
MNTLNQQILLSIPNACARVHLGRSFLYKRIADGSIRSVKAGRRRLIVAASLNEWAANLPQTPIKQFEVSK